MRIQRRPDALPVRAEARHVTLVVEHRAGRVRAWDETAEEEARRKRLDRLLLMAKQNRQGQVDAATRDGIREIVSQVATTSNAKLAIEMALIGLVSHVGQAQGPEFEAAVSHTVHNIEDLARMSYYQAKDLVMRAMAVAGVRRRARDCDCVDCRRRARDMIHPDYSKVKHLAAVQEAAREYREAAKRRTGGLGGGDELKAAETKLNNVVEKALSPRDADWSKFDAAMKEVDKAIAGLSATQSQKMQVRQAVQAGGPSLWENLAEGFSRAAIIAWMASLWDHKTVDRRTRRLVIDNYVHAAPRRTVDEKTDGSVHEDGSKYNVFVYYKEDGKSKKEGPFSSREKAYAWMKQQNIATRDARMFPSYTLAELEAWLLKPDLPADTRAKAEQEIAARKAGTSQVSVTPQILGGKPVTKVGRL